MDLSDPDTFSDGMPTEIFRHLRDDAPVFWHEPTANTPDGEGFWCLTRYEDVAWAAKNPTMLSSVNGGPRRDGGTLIEDLPVDFAAGVLFNMTDDPRHHHVRRVVTPCVSPKRLRTMEALLRERCNALLDAAVASGGCDFLVDVAAELPLQAMAELLGVPESDRRFLLEWADATLDYDDHNPGEYSARVAEAGAQMAEYAEHLMRAKRSCPGDDIVSAIVHADLPDAANPGGALSALEQSMFVHLLVAAGTETTRNSIVAGLLAMIDRPEQFDALRADRGLLDGAVEESLRWASSTVYNRRTATTNIERHGSTIAPGDKVVLWWQAANFDERAFERPERFDIRRAPNPHLAFGAGSHFCLGANMARLEMRLVFGGLAERVRRIESAGPAIRTRSNKHAGFRHAPVRLVPAS